MTDNTDPSQELREENLIIGDIEIVGFAQFCRNQTPQETFAMLTDYYNLVDTGISKAGGRVVKFIVDRVLFIFPSDLAQEAVATLRDLKEVGDQWVRSYNPSGYVTIKAHAGTVVCGMLGTDKDKRFDIVGEPVNELFMSAGDEFALSYAVENLLSKKD